MARVKSLSEVLSGVTRFGRLTVTGEAPRIVSPSGFAAHAAHVRCDCGAEKIARAGDLKNGYTESCGCLQRELVAQRIGQSSRTHGQAVHGKQTAEYRIWSGMKARCYRPDEDHYPRYGGRGIGVCQRWRESFEAFFDDMGSRPSPDHSIERHDNDGDYEPDNCRWATRIEQCNNRSSNRIVEIGGQSRSVVEWSRHSGVDAMLIYQRLDAGWDDRKSVFTLPMRKGVKRGAADARRR